MLCLYSCHLNDLKYLFYKCIFSNSSEERRNRPFWCIFFSVVVLMRRWSTSATWTARLCASCCGAPSETWASLTTSSGDFSPCHFHPQHGFFSLFFLTLCPAPCVSIRLLKDNLQDSQFRARYQHLLAALLCCVGRGLREQFDRQCWMVSILAKVAQSVRDAAPTARQVWWKNVCWTFQFWNFIECMKYWREISIWAQVNAALVTV